MNSVDHSGDLILGISSFCPCEWESKNLVLVKLEVAPQFLFNCSNGKQCEGEDE